jgi:hypothetical protein
LPNVLGRRYALGLWGLVVASGLSGCAVYDPFQVWRFTADYNTQRCYSAQATYYDHLPPKNVRVRMVQWGYNVGPNGPAIAFPIPSDAQTTPVLPPPAPPAPAMIPVAPPADDDLLDRSQPPEFPTAPLPDRSSAPGPTAEGETGIERSAYTTAPARRITSRAWLFSGPRK